MMYIYAVTDPAPHPLPQIAGLDHQPPETFTEAGLCVILSHHAPQTFSPTADNVWRHEQLVESLMPNRTVLPARFGTTFPAEHDLRDVLCRRAPALRAGLDQVRGCVELGLRVLDPNIQSSPSPPPPQTHPSGRDWMLARLVREQHSDQARKQDQLLATSLHNPLAALAHDATFRIRPGLRFLMTAAYLVPRDSVNAFTDRIGSLAVDHPNLQLLCTGPWPPYHFTPAFHTTEHAHA
jgi:hypothetical protein